MSSKPDGDSTGGNCTGADSETQASLSVDQGEWKDRASEFPTMFGKQSSPGASTGELGTRITMVQAVKMNSQSGEACLVLIYPPGPDMGKRFPLSRCQFVLGRSAGCDVQVDRDSVSRRHARVYHLGEGWLLEDLQSTNGSYINDVPVTKSPLRDGDFVKIGAAIFKFLAGAGIEANYHEAIYRLIIIDALTGAYNKRYLLEFLQREIVRCARYGRPLSLIMFDIDHFKLINDKHGHLAGDYVLKELSRRLLGRVREEELFARYGGEEFAVVLPESDLTSARTFGEVIRQRVAEQPFEYEGDVIPVSVSVGVACIEGQDIDVIQFVQIAEDNLYRAKREGRNRVVVGSGKWSRWKADPAFQSQVSSRTAVAALSLLARDQILASTGGVAHVDDLEGLLYSRLREHQTSEQILSFGALEGGSKLLVAIEGRNPAHRLGAVLFETLRRCAEECPEAQFAVGPVRLAKEGAAAIENAVAGLDEEISFLENGYYLPQPVAMALRALDGMMTARAKAVLELGETLLQWISLCAVAELGVKGDATRTTAALRRNLGRGITMERWCEVLAIGIAEILEAGAVHNLAWHTCFASQSLRDQVLDWLSSLAELGGTFARGATASDGHITRKIVDEVAPRLRQLVKRDLRAVLALIPAEVELVGFEGELQSYRMTRLIGDGMAASVPMYSRRRMNPGLWLCDAIADRAVPLEPFFVRDTCPKCGARELFLLARLDELEFRNPASGHVLKKPIDDLPFSAEARERLRELTDPSNAGGQPLQGFETTDRSTLQAPIREGNASAERPSHPGIAPSSSRPVMKQHTILFLAANPTGTDRFALDREARAIQVELERSGFRDRFELVTRWAAEPLDLLRELRKLRPTVIHFSGHGSQSGVEHQSGHAPPGTFPGDPWPHEVEQERGLYFQGADGRAQLVTTSALEETFGAAGASVKLVVLNACYSEVQAGALLAHIDCVVGMGDSIRSDAARNFAIGFYGGLGERESVAAAYKQGRAAISLEGLRDSDRPQLKVRAGIDASRLVLAADPQ